MPEIGRSKRSSCKAAGNFKNVIGTHYVECSCLKSTGMPFLHSKKTKISIFGRFSQDITCLQNRQGKPLCILWAYD